MLNKVLDVTSQKLGIEERLQVARDLLAADPSEYKAFTPYLCRLFLQLGPHQASELVKEDLPKAKAYLWAYHKLTTEKKLRLSLYRQETRRRRTMDDNQPVAFVLSWLFHTMEKHLPLLKGEPLPDYVDAILGEDICHGAPAELGRQVEITDPEEVELIENGDITIIANNPHYKYVQLNTIRGSRFVGRGTQWCTAMRDEAGERNFDGYSKRGPLSVLMFRGSSSKYQFHFGGFAVNDETDSRVNLTSVLAHLSDFKTAQSELISLLFCPFNISNMIEDMERQKKLQLGMPDQAICLLSKAQLKRLEKILIGQNLPEFAWMAGKISEAGKNQIFTETIAYAASATKGVKLAAIEYLFDFDEQVRHANNEALQHYLSSGKIVDEDFANYLTSDWLRRLPEDVLAALSNTEIKLVENSLVGKANPSSKKTMATLPNLGWMADRLSPDSKKKIAAAALETVATGDLVYGLDYLLSYPNIIGCGEADEFVKATEILYERVANKSSLL